MQTYSVNYRNALDRLCVRVNIILFVCKVVDQRLQILPSAQQPKGHSQPCLKASSKDISWRLDSVVCSLHYFILIWSG